MKTKEQHNSAGCLPAGRFYRFAFRFMARQWNRRRLSRLPPSHPFRNEFGEFFFNHPIHSSGICRLTRLLPFKTNKKTLKRSQVNRELEKKTSTTVSKSDPNPNRPTFVDIWSNSAFFFWFTGLFVERRVLGKQRVAPGNLLLFHLLLIHFGSCCCCCCCCCCWCFICKNKEEKKPRASATGRRLSRPGLG